MIDYAFSSSQALLVTPQNCYLFDAIIPNVGHFQVQVCGFFLDIDGANR